MLTSHAIFVLGVLLTATCLVTEMCELNPEIVSHFRRVSVFPKVMLHSHHSTRKTMFIHKFLQVL